LIERKMSLNPLDHPIVFSFPRRLTPYSAWHQHIPFAMFLVDLLKPRVVVELGAHYGDSYCAFCQAVHELDLPARCYAIDTWEGDLHAGFYGPEVLTSLREHHDPLYGSFSSLVKTTFDEALRHFSDDTIDLLHVDGYHTYEAVKHDFESWLPKMSARGVVLFHDIHVRERNFGVWKLWEETTKKHLYFEFVHGHGLGVLAVGKDFPTALQEFLEASLEDAANIRRFFFQLGQRLTFKIQQRNLSQEVAQLQLTLQAQRQALAEKEERANRIGEDRDRLARDVTELQSSLSSQRQALAEKEEHANRTGEDRDRLARDVTELQSSLSSQQQALAEKEEHSNRLAGDVTQLQAALNSGQQALAAKQCQLDQLSLDQERLGQEALILQATVRGQREELADKALQILDLVTQEDRSNHQLESMRIRFQEKEREVTKLYLDQERLGREVSRLQATVQHQWIALEMAYGTLGWLVTNRFRPVKDKLLIPGSRLRQIYDYTLAGLKNRLRNGYLSPPNEIYPTQLGFLIENESDNKPVFGQPIRQNGTIDRRRAPGAVKSAPRFGGRHFAIYTSSVGNYFFSELRDLLAAAFQSLGFQVDVRDEREGFSEVADWHLIIAPHEFFYLGGGSELRNQPSPSNLILFNTEQPSTQWYARAYHCFSKAYGIWDINHDSSQEISREGFNCEYLRLGYLSDFKPFQEIKELPEHYGTCSLDEKIRKNTYLHKPFADRPIDVLFLGTLSARREKFFAHTSRVLSNHICYLHLPEAQGPLLAGFNTPMDTTTSVGLAQRSKILLNIHRGADRYFEWHRIVMHGIWNRALVVTEPCGDGPPFQPGVHFIEAPLSQIPDVVEYYLTDPKGQVEAQAITLRGFQTLSEQCKLTECLAPILLRSCRVQLPNPKPDFSYESLSAS
jgi:Methyltransferase domain